MGMIEKILLLSFLFLSLALKGPNSTVFLASLLHSLFNKLIMSDFYFQTTSTSQVAFFSKFYCTRFVSAICFTWSYNTNVAIVRKGHEVVQR